MSGQAEADTAEIARAVDELYQLPLDQFVSARNLVATRARKLDRDVAQAIKKLAKPSVSAWAVNQIFWHARPEYDALLDAGENVRACQRRALAGTGPASELQAAVQAQRAAISAALKQAEKALERGGHGTALALMRRVSTTLEALAVRGRDPTMTRHGRLLEDLPAPGFGALAGLANAKPAAKPAPRATEAATAPAVAAEAETRAAPSGRDQAKPGRVLAHPMTRGDGRATGRKSANDNETDAALEREKRLVAEREARLAREKEREQARERARLVVAEARAAVRSKERAVGDAERSEKGALDRVYAAEKAVASAERELARVTATRDRAIEHAEHAKAQTARVHSNLADAEKRLAAAEHQLAELGSE